MIALTFTALGLTLFTLLIAAEEYRRLKARLRHEFEEAFGHAHRGGVHRQLLQRPMTPRTYGWKRSRKTKSSVVAR